MKSCRGLLKRQKRKTFIGKIEMYQWEAIIQNSNHEQNGNLEKSKYHWKKL